MESKCGDSLAYANSVVVQTGDSEFSKLVDGPLKIALQEAYNAGYAAAKAESKWISVKERLPEKLALVMLCDKDGEYWWGYYGHDLRWHYNFGDGIKEGKEFTDWQPLPPPPEAK